MEIGGAEVTAAVECKTEIYVAAMVMMKFLWRVCSGLILWFFHFRCGNEKLCSSCDFADQVNVAGIGYVDPNVRSKMLEVKTTDCLAGCEVEISTHKFFKDDCWGCHAD